jgi:hypothetical protein
MGSIRERARQILSVVPPLGQQINSVGATASLFTKLTGVDQATLQKNWDGGGIMTTCNGFTGWFSRELGSKLYLGRFDLDTYLPKNNLGHAWIKSTPGSRPKFGDICRYAKFHVGISLDFEGDIWNHVDSGQGGKKTGYDIIKRIRDTNPYEHTKLLGWVDLEKYFGESSATGDEATEPTAADKANGPVPNWLLGWWNVSWRGQAFYYYFDSTYSVKWTQMLPRDTTRPALSANDTGKVSVESPSDFSIVWGKTGSIEKFSRPLGTSQMRGSWNSKEPLAASKM